MALPKITHPTAKVEIPSSKQRITIRPMLGKEEKILAMAKHVDEQDEILRAVTQVVQNCIVDAVDVDQLTTFDIEYLFVQLRAFSVNNIVKVSYRDLEDDEVREFSINLLDVKVKFPEAATSNTIQVSKDIRIELRYPRASLYKSETYLSNLDAEASMQALIVESIAAIWDGDKRYTLTESPDDEVKAWLEDLPIKTSEEIRLFLAESPRLFHEIKYTNKNGKERVMPLRSLSDFFTLV